MNEEKDTVYGVHGSTLTNIADAIRDKTGETDLMKVADMAENIDSIEVAPEKKQIEAKTFGQSASIALGLGSIQHLIPYLSEIYWTWSIAYNTYYLNDVMFRGLSTSPQNPIDLGGITFIIDANHGDRLTYNTYIYISLYITDLYIINPPKFRIINNDNPEYKISFAPDGVRVFFNTPDIETFDMYEIYGEAFSGNNAIRKYLGDNWSGRTTQTKRFYNMPLATTELPQSFNDLEEITFDTKNVYTGNNITLTFGTRDQGAHKRWPKYTKDNFVKTLESLYDFTGNTKTHQIQLPRNTKPTLPFSLSDLTENEIAIATDKGWTITGV